MHIQVLSVHSQPGCAGTKAAPAIRPVRVVVRRHRDSLGLADVGRRPPRLLTVLVSEEYLRVIRPDTFLGRKLLEVLQVPQPLGRCVGQQWRR